jgi:hypothetical protein
MERLQGCYFNPPGIPSRKKVHNCAFGERNYECRSRKSGWLAGKARRQNEHLVVARAAGGVQPDRELVERWLNVDLAGDILVRAEDPVEDVFVTNVVTGGGNRRIFTGVWETPDFWLQSLIDVLSAAPRTPQFNRIRGETDALLRLGDLPKVSVLFVPLVTLPNNRDYPIQEG